MSCSNDTIVDCGIIGTLVQDCVECKWVVYNQTPLVIYQASEIVSASGIIEESSNTDGMTQVTITFFIGKTEITNFTITNRQSFSFTVIGFDTITLKGNAASSLESASGRFCLTPRYQAY